MNAKFGTRITSENSLRVQRRVLWQGANLVQALLTTFICCFIEWFEGQSLRQGNRVVGIACGC